MSKDWTLLGKDGIPFFGKICASVTHELKNSLALINENAGLIEDLFQMAEQGASPDPALLTKSLKRIKNNVLRANDTIGRLNRFAHLTDIPCGSVDVGQEVQLLVLLHERLAAMKKIQLVYNSQPSALVLYSRPYLFALALHQCLTWTVDNTKDSIVSVAISSNNGGAEIHFSAHVEVSGKEEQISGQVLAALHAQRKIEENGLSLFVQSIPMDCDGKDSQEGAHEQ